MPRKLRLEYEGAIYHLMNRGDRREDLVVDEKDRARFLETLAEACQKTDWQIHGYCLMQNHFHLVVETPKANLSVGMQWLLGTYTARFNRRHRFVGHLFSGRFKSLVVEGSGNGYLKTVCDYVHLNPVRAKLLRAGEPLEAFAWSSYPQYLKSPSERPPWLRADRLLGEWGVQQDDSAGRRQFAAGMEERRTAGTKQTVWRLESAAARLVLWIELSGRIYWSELKKPREASTTGWSCGNLASRRPCGCWSKCCRRRAAES